MSNSFDIVIIGAGPAGMTAAVEADRHGASVCLLDEQSDAGGQIYRNVAQAPAARTKIMGEDYREGAALVENLDASGAVHRRNVTVWKVGKDGAIAFSKDGQAEQIYARHIIIANGATERAVPVPGWTTPGVMTVGAAQILMKTSGIMPVGAVLIGSGPLLYLVARQLVAAGAPPKALVETQTRADLIRAMRHFWQALRGWKQLVKGVGLIAAIWWARVPRHTGATDIAIEGEGFVERIRFRAKGRDHVIQSDTVLLHQGVVPNTQVARSIGLDQIYDTAQFCFKPVTDAHGQSSNPLFSVAGDGAGIGGAKVAAISGRLSALNALRQINKITETDREKRAGPLLERREAEMAIRPFLDAAYPPPQQVLSPADDTIICRCEEVRAGDIRRYAALGCTGPNQTKSFGRSGMGACQGRYCGLVVTEILAEETGQSQDAVGSYRIRAPLKPISLGELAGLSDGKTP